jgi:hypothetical protein
MDLYLWLTVCIVLLFICWGLIFFRRPLIRGLSRYPTFVKVLAVVVAALLFVLSLFPFLVWFIYGIK